MRNIQSYNTENNVVTPSSMPGPTTESEISEIMARDIEAAAVANIAGLLKSQHYDVLYGAPFRGEDVHFLKLISNCENAGQDIINEPNEEILRYRVSIIDAGLIQEMPAAELRSLCRDIMTRDPKLIAHMPQLRARLVKICCAIDLSRMLRPEVLSAIQRDVETKNKWSSNAS